MAERAEQHIQSGGGRRDGPAPSLDPSSATRPPPRACRTSGGLVRACAGLLLICCGLSGCVSDAELAQQTLSGNVEAAVELRERHRAEWEPGLRKQLLAMGATSPARVLEEWRNHGAQRPLAGALGGAPGLFLITHFVAGPDRLNEDWQWVCVAFLFTAGGALDVAQILPLPDRDLVREPRLALREEALRVHQGGRVLVYRRQAGALVLRGS